MQINDQNIMVTGGVGFVGSHLVDELLKRDCKIVTYDNLSPFYTGKEDNIKQQIGNKNFKFIKEDILNFNALKASMKNIDIVFHLAAQPGVRYSIEYPLQTNEINVTGTLNVLLAARANNVKKVISVSSSSVYGRSSKLPLSEDGATSPESPYGASKLAAEEYCKVFHSLYDLDVVMPRYFTAVGARQRPDNCPRIFVKSALEEKPIIIFGDGKQSRDYVSVHDVVRGTIASAEIDGVAGEILNIGSGHGVTINELANFIIELTDKKGIVEIQHEPPKRGEILHTLADLRKVRRILKYSPTIPIKESLRELVAWYTAKQKSTP